MGPHSELNLINFLDFNISPLSSHTGPTYDREPMNAWRIVKHTKRKLVKNFFLKKKEKTFVYIWEQYDCLFTSLGENWRHASSVAICECEQCIDMCDGWVWCRYVLNSNPYLPRIHVRLWHIFAWISHNTRSLRFQIIMLISLLHGKERKKQSNMYFQRVASRCYIFVRSEFEEFQTD